MWHDRCTGLSEKLSPTAVCGHETHQGETDQGSSQPLLWRSALRAEMTATASRHYSASPSTLGPPSMHASILGNEEAPASQGSGTCGCCKVVPSRSGGDVTPELACTSGTGQGVPWKSSGPPPCLWHPFLSQPESVASHLTLQAWNRLRRPPWPAQGSPCIAFPSSSSLVAGLHFPPKVPPRLPNGSPLAGFGAVPIAC